MVRDGLCAPLNTPCARYTSRNPRPLLMSYLNRTRRLSPSNIVAFQMFIPYTREVNRFMNVIWYNIIGRPERGRWNSYISGVRRRQAFGALGTRMFFPYLNVVKVLRLWWWVFRFVSNYHTKTMDRQLENGKLIKCWHLPNHMKCLTAIQPIENPKTNHPFIIRLAHRKK